MKTWQSALLWAAYPFLLLLFVFGFIAALNWGYESKLISLDTDASDWNSVHLGPILLTMAMGMALIASFLLFLVFLCWPKSRLIWFLIPLTFITILLVFPGLFIVIFGPASITMIEQTRSASSLPFLSDLHIPVIDGKEKFSELFHLNDDYKLSYKETFDHPPNPTLADALDKQWAHLNDASLQAYSQRLRKGFQGVLLYTFYVSKTSKLVVEKMGDDQWSKGYVTETYFTGENITEIDPDRLEPSAGIATIFPPDASRYPELLINFPALHGALGYIPDKLQMIMGKAPMFVIVKKNMPVAFLLKLGSNQTLVETEEVVFPNKKLCVSKFEYSTQSHLWPSSITTDVTGSDGTNLGHGTWSLLKIEKLPHGFDFSPKIEPNYRVVDKTASKTSN